MVLFVLGLLLLVPWLLGGFGLLALCLPVVCWLVFRLLQFVYLFLFRRVGLRLSLRSSSAVLVGVLGFALVFLALKCSLLVLFQFLPLL
jgi:hypothetical protein